MVVGSRFDPRGKQSRLNRWLRTKEATHLVRLVRHCHWAPANCRGCQHLTVATPAKQGHKMVTQIRNSGADG